MWLHAKWSLIVVVATICCLSWINITTGKKKFDAILDLDKMPNPTIDFQSCGRKGKSFICDPELYINPKYSDQFDASLINATKSDLVWCPRSENNNNEKYGTINKIDRSDNELRGLQIGITIISSFKNYDYTIPVTADYNDVEYLSKKYAKSIHDQWGIGDKDCNNGLMIFIAIDDRALYISTGKAIKNIITDQFINHYIMNNIRGYMRQQQYDKAIFKILELIYEMLLYQDDQENSYIYSDWNRAKDRISNNDDTLFSLFGFWDVSFEDLFIVALVTGAIGYFYHKSKRQSEYRQCQNRLAAIYAQSQQRRFNQDSCPICLDEFNNNDSDSTRPTSLLACGHKFCTECLDSWFGNQMRSQHRCPVCRQHRDDLSNIPENYNGLTDDDIDTTNSNVENNNNDNTDNKDNSKDKDKDSNDDNKEHTTTTTTTTTSTNENDNTDEKKHDFGDITRDSTRDNNNNNNNNRNGNHPNFRDYRSNNNNNNNNNDFTNDFPSTDKTQTNDDTSTFYGADRANGINNDNNVNGGANTEYLRDRQRRRDGSNTFWRTYAATSIANDLLYRNDLNFRLRRMRHLYPRYIDDNMVNRWSSNTYNGGNFAQDSSFQARNPIPPASSMNSHSGASRRSRWGSGGSGSGGSFSFGGGSSFGGGGGGGRW